MHSFIREMSEMTLYSSRQNAVSPSVITAESSFRPSDKAHIGQMSVRPHKYQHNTQDKAVKHLCKTILFTKWHKVTAGQPYTCTAQTDVVQT